MLTEKNFADALRAMNFTRRADTYDKTFAEGVTMKADLKARTLHYPAQIKGRDRNNFFDAAHKENLVVFECVNRLLDKGYNPADIWLEKPWQLGHLPKSGRADICVSSQGRTLFIIECKTAGAEFNHELANMQSDGGQLFSYWQQEQSCQWLMLYASDFDGDLKFSAASVSCNEKLYRDAHTVEERFKVWSERCDKKFLGDVIFHDETRAYQIGVKPLRKRDLKNFSENKSVVNKFEEILRHNQVSNKETAFNRLIALFICKLVDETNTPDDGEVAFQFKDGVDTNETFQDRLQRLYAEGMEKFMREPITYVPLARVDELLNQIGAVRREELSAAFKADYRKLKFFNNNAFAFIDVHNEKLFYINAKILAEVVDILKDYKIIGSEDLQTLGDLFEQLLDKGFKQNEGQFFTPLPITRFIWDSLPLDDLIGDAPPKIIDYACGAGHFLTEGFKAVNDCFARKNLTPPPLWERDKLFGVEKDDRLARVSKISLFMHGADEGKIKFGDGLENYPDEGITPAAFDILVANPPYAVKGFKAHLKLANDNFDVFDKISNDGSEIETLFVERIAQLVKPRGVAAVILPSSILNKDGKSFIAAREALLKNFYIRAIVQLGNKTFSATSVSTVIFFLQRIFDPPERAQLLKDSAEIILSGAIQAGDEEEAILAGYLERIGKTAAELSEADRDKIIYFGLTYRQTTLIISAPDDVKGQEKFLGYGWSNAKGREGIVYKKRGGLLFDNDNRAADNTLAAVSRAAFRSERLNLRGLDKYYRYVTTADLLDFDAADFTKAIKLVKADYVPVEYGGSFPTVKLGEVAPFVTERTTVDDIQLADYVTTDNMLKDKRGIKPYDGVPQTKAATKFLAGDVLISNIRPYLKKIWLADRAGGCSTNVLVLRSRDENILLPEYLFEALKDDAFFEFMNATAKGLKMPCGDKDTIQTYKLPLPPLDVQRQIVDEFDAVAAQIQSADSTITSLDAAVKTKFAALFEGKHFQTRTIDELFDLQIGKTPARDNQSYWSDGLHKWISVGDLGKYDRFTGDTDEKISQSAVDETGIKIVPAGTVIMSFKLTIGRTAITSESIYTNEAIAAFISKTNLIDADYLRLHLQRHDWSSGQMRAVKGLTLNKQSIGRASIPVPPPELQEEFAAYVRNCEALKESARRRRAELLALRAELTAKYFR